MSPAPNLFRVAGAENGRPLLDVLATRLHLSRRQAKHLLDVRAVFVNCERVWMAKHTVRTGDEIEVRVALPRGKADKDAPWESDVKILWSDEDYLIVAKPAGRLSNGKGSVEDWLRLERKENDVRAVHRLDRDTSGCLMLARHEKAWKALVEVFEARAVEKVYRALAVGRYEPERETIRQPLDGQQAVTHVKVLRTGKLASYLELSLETGRTHQVRRHLTSRRHPLIGDRRYLTGEVRTEEFRAAPRQMLHAWRVTFTHPRTGETVRVVSEEPADFAACRRQLGL